MVETKRILGPVIRPYPECGHVNESKRLDCGIQLPAPRTCEACDAPLVPIARPAPDRHQVRLGVA